MVLDFRSGRGSFTNKGVLYRGHIISGAHGTPAAEDVAAITEDITSAIVGMDLSGFGDGVQDPEDLRAVLFEYSDVFSPTTETVPGVEYKILIKPNADLSNLNRPTFRKAPKEQETEREEIQKLLDRGIVQPSTSCYGTNNVFVEKKRHPDGTSAGLRVTADMRAMNSVSVGDAFPTEDVKEIVSWIATKCWYSVLDLRDGYWNITLCEESRPFTAVKTVVGLVEYTRMTMGLKNASAFFQRVINEKYKGLKGEILAAYQDDLSIGSETVAKHLVDVRKVLQRTREAKLRLKLPKCAFGRREAAVLRHQVSLGKIKPGVEHQNAMARFREPTNGSELLRFLGVLNFFREFIEDGAG
jgi:Reverse transcriptase (RNA-dependent DNA polymerase)